MSEKHGRTWAVRLDWFCIITGALVPAGLVIGNIGFESMVGLVGLGWILRCFFARENPFAELAKHPLVIPWLAWYVGVAISVAFNGAGSKGWAHDMVFIRYALYGIALLDISRRLPVPRYLIFGLAAGVLWAAVNTLSAYAFGFDLLAKPLIRYSGKLKEASRISGMAAFAAPFFLIWAGLDEKLSARLKVVIAIIGLIAFAQVLQTHIRTAIIASAAGIFFGAAYFIKKQKTFGLALAVVLVVVFSAGVVFYVGRMFVLSSVYDRIYFWKVAWRLWLDHPVLGVGISSFQDAYNQMAMSGAVPAYIAPDGEVFSGEVQTHAHNLFFMLISCTGLLGLVTFSWLFVNATRLVFSDLKGFRIALIAWPVVLLVIGLTGFNIYHSWYQALLAFFLALIGSRNFTNIEDRHA